MAAKDENKRIGRNNPELISCDNVSIRACCGCDFFSLSLLIIRMSTKSFSECRMTTESDVEKGGEHSSCNKFGPKIVAERDEDVRSQSGSAGFSNHSVEALKCQQ
jgi:hypothetical protein